MSQVMFPRSSYAIPKTQAEQYTAENNNEQPLLAGSGTMNYQDPPDEPGDEMAKDARVWRTYVRETDKWDKEMVEGRNNSLDVLLIFVSFVFESHDTDTQTTGFQGRIVLCYLNCVSTGIEIISATDSQVSSTQRFVIESLGDLKPDPTESSSQTLLLMSQTLIAISNGQPVQMLDQATLDPTFTPSRTAVVVNLLWFLSLSLSVAVSLIAMLAKEWCYMFMSRRSGPMHEQARRRQERWNGIERWKMKQVLTYLPGLMHIALLLFATGLSIYLWDINVRVAVPVVAMTAGASLVYVCTTLLPLLDNHCPYASPLTFLLLDFHNVAIHSVRAAGFSFFDSLHKRINEPNLLVSALKLVRDVLTPEIKESKNHSTDIDVPMDIASLKRSVLKLCRLVD